MKHLFLILCLILLGNTLTAQLILKENLSKKQSTYWDFQQKQLLSVGSFFKDDKEVTTDKHGQWLFYDRLGNLEEERNFFRGKVHGKVMTYLPGKQPQNEGYFYLGLQDSVYREWNDQGKLVLEGWYDLGVAIGEWKYFYPNGRSKSVEEITEKTNKIVSFWLNDSLHTQTISNGNGTLMTYYNSGRLKESFTYVSGLKDGPFVEKNAQDIAMTQGFFKLGKKDSAWLFQYSNGLKEKECGYKNDSLHGLSTSYFNTGKMSVQGMYVNGQKTGSWTWYLPNGNRDMSGTFKENQQHGDWVYWYDSGEISYTAHYDKGLRTGQWTYLYKNGEKFKEGSYEKDKKSGKWFTWYEDGTLLMEGAYIDGKEDGVWNNYWENGKLKNTTTFKDGEMNGKWTSYYENGKIKLTGYYKDNFKVDEWISYFENGKPKDVYHYKIFKEKSKIDYGVMKDRVHRESLEDGVSISFSKKDYNRTEEGMYKRGKKDGQWVAYHPGGKLPAVVSNYADGELNGSMKQYDRRGKLLQEMDFKDGVKHGRFIVYDKRGKVLIEKKFDTGREVIEGQNGPRQQFSPPR